MGLLSSPPLRTLSPPFKRVTDFGYITIKPCAMIRIQIIKLRIPLRGNPKQQTVK